MTKYTVASLLKDDNFEGVVIDRLKVEGWLDWHLLMAIAIIVGNERLKREAYFDFDGLKSPSKLSAMEIMTRPELEQEVLNPGLFRGPSSVPQSFPCLRR